MIKIDRLSKKERELRMVQRLLELEEKKQKIYRRDIHTIKMKQRRKKIFKAGLLFAEAGILDSYDRDVILKLLKETGGTDNGRNKL